MQRSLVPLQCHWKMLHRTCHSTSVRLPTSCSSGCSLTYFQGPQVLQIPRITPETHVVAVLGIENANRRMDGWMWADLCFLNQILRGLGTTQAWFTLVDGARLLKKQGPTVFRVGNPHRTRKVIRSKEIALENVLMKSKLEPKEAFLPHLRLVADEIKLGDHLLVIMIGHGYEVNFGIFVGHGEQTASTAEVRSAISNCSLITDDRCCAPSDQLLLRWLDS